jgi:hypothetical protein
MLYQFWVSKVCLSVTRFSKLHHLVSFAPQHFAFSNLRVQKISFSYSVDLLLWKVPHLETASQLSVSVRTAQRPPATCHRRITGDHISMVACL